MPSRFIRVPRAAEPREAAVARVLQATAQWFDSL